MLNQLDLQQIQQTLQSEHARILKRVSSNADENEQSKERNPDRTDLSWDYTSRDRKLALLSIEKKTLTQNPQVKQVLSIKHPMKNTLFQ